MKFEWTYNMTQNTTETNVLATLTPLTDQQVFDNALFGIRAQGYKKSAMHHFTGSTGRCAYRGNNGLKCGIGHSIPDSLYDDDFDHPDRDTYIRTLMVAIRGHGADLRRLFGQCDRTLLTQLQTAHDDTLECGGSAGAVHFEVTMNKIARDYGLTYTPPATNAD